MEKEDVLYVKKNSIILDTFLDTLRGGWARKLEEKLEQKVRISATFGSLEYVKVCGCDAMWEPERNIRTAAKDSSIKELTDL